MVAVAARALRTHHIRISARRAANDSALNSFIVRATPTSMFASSVIARSGGHYLSTAGCRSELRNIQTRCCYSSLLQQRVIKAPSNFLIKTWIHHDRRILCIQLRQKTSDAHDSSSSSNGISSSSSSSSSQPIQSLHKLQNPQATEPDLSTSTLTNAKRKSRRRKKPFSPVHKITINHPKNSTPHTHAPLTRKQLLRLSQKQRANLKHHLIEEGKRSITYLDQARTNVRANLKFIKGSAESNLEKNIQTIKRLFNGEYVWKDEAASEASKSADAPGKKQESLQWENLPSAIQSNVKNNISTLQNWLHKVTDGAIPSPNIDNSASSSIANRLQKFHEMKQNQPLVMDNKWIAWNVLLALMPGFMVHLVCLSMQDEMKEFYSELEKKEQERVLGSGVVAGDGTAGMGLSSALVSEGGSTWEKMKMAVNDLFFGGVDEKVRAVSSQDIENESQDSTDRSMPNDQILSKEMTASINPNPEHIQSTGSLDKEATIETLLQRIRALEKQVGIEQLSKENTAHNQIEHTKESPIRSRRDDYLRSQWQKQTNKKDIVPHKEEEEEESFILQSIIENVKNWIQQLDTNSMIELANNKCAELANELPFSVRVVETQSKTEVLTENNAAAVVSEGHPVTESRDESAQLNVKHVDTNGDEVQSNKDDTSDIDDESKTRSRWHNWWHVILRRGKTIEQKEPQSE